MLREWETTVTVSITTNLSQFAVHKAFWNEKEIRQIIIDNPGISFDDFFEKAQAINGEYNLNHLVTEFNTTTRSSEMYEDWKRIEAQKESKPYLRYKTQEDSLVRDSHRSLNNIVRAVDDDFWLTYYPPNDFNCRCYVEQLEEAEETDLNFENVMNKTISSSDISPYFSGNVYKTGKVFSDQHPYFHGVSKSDQKELNKIAAKLAKKRDK